ncbi:hypothetical protein ABZZ36_00170 [Actinacidiphila glaucinigra]|uniref:hypothetical protein n=1 Tax=Actinacidiphila glaucinigra TaxID=235986 RepID=UPI0033A289F0
MRHTTAAAVAATALLLTGCGTQSGGPAGGSPSGSPSGTGTAGPGGGGGTGGACLAEAALTAEDTGRTVCLTAGGTVRVTLDGTPDRPWSPVTSEGSALTPTNAGIGAPRGDTIAAYRATAPGTARLTSTQPLCASPTAPDQVACLGLREWTVTVRVAGN